MGESDEIPNRENFCRRKVTIFFFFEIFSNEVFPDEVILFDYASKHEMPVPDALIALNSTERIFDDTVSV